MKNLREGCENMKKIITVVTAVLLVGCISLVLCGCGAEEEEITTNAPTSSVAERTTNSGMVTDRPDTGGNGVIGDIVTDVSEGVSEMITDVSEDISRIAD